MSWETGGIVEFKGMRSVAVGVVGVDCCVGEVRDGSESGDDGGRLGDSGSRMLLGKPGMRLLKGKSSADWGSDVGVDVGAIEVWGVGVGAIELSSVGAGVAAGVEVGGGGTEMI